MVRKFAALAQSAGFAAVFLWRGLAVEAQLVYFAILILAFAIFNVVLFYSEIHRAADVTLTVPPLLWLGAAAILILLSPSYFIQFFIVIASALVYIKLLLQIPSRGSARSWDSSFLLSSGGIFLGIWAADFYFTPGWWLLMLMSFCVSFGLFWIGFYSTHSPRPQKFFFALVNALLMMEITWALLFWPLHFVPMTLVYVGFFYTAWMIPKIYLTGMLNSKKILFHLAIVGIMELLVMSSAAWLPVSA